MVPSCKRKKSIHFMLFSAWIPLQRWQLLVCAAPLLAWGLLWPVCCLGQSVPAFDDHTRRNFQTTQEFSDFAREGGEPAAVKFVLPFFSGDADNRPALVNCLFLQPSFYRMHDEWYWFSLLNGQSVPGLSDKPLQGNHFSDIAAIYAAFAHTRALPLGLRWVEERIYSTYFYDISVGPIDDRMVPRQMAVGTVIYLPPDPKRLKSQALWLLQLEETDPAREAALLHILHRVARALPPDAQLQWLPRSSPSQQALAQQLRNRGGELQNRIVFFSEIAVPGQALVYNPGIAAGHIKIVAPGSLHSANLRSDDIVILSEIPDELPPVAAIITTVPQTPQAHLNLLAVARGTPNGYVQGIDQWPALRALARSGQPAVIELADGHVRYRAMTEQQFFQWLEQVRPVEPSSRVAMMANPPAVVLLDKVAQGGLQNALLAMHRWLPVIGGKAAGLLALLGQPNLATPYRPLALTTNGYVSHLQPLQPLLTALLTDPEFLAPRARLLLLEGQASFDKMAAHDPAAQAWLALFRKRTHGPAVTRVLAEGGVQAIVAHRPLPVSWWQQVEPILAKQFEGLSDDQPLRFRSSSTAEDVDGCNAAGVYASYSGYLHAERAKTPQLRSKTAARAIAKVWASFWSYDAFEERQQAEIAHLDAKMAIMVEPGFPDAVETANGVVLFGLGIGPDGASRMEMTVNVQPGALSVTNPPPGQQVVPEIDRVTAGPGQAPQIERLGNSSALPNGQVVSDAELQKAFAELTAFAEPWMAAKGVGLNPGQKPLSTVLDLEFRRVAPGWPAMTQGAPDPARWVWKQVRPLSRAARLRARDVVAPTPIDVLQAAVRAARKHCQNGPLTVDQVLVWTHPSATLLPFAQAPLVVQTLVTFDATGLGYLRGERLQLDARTGLLRVQAAVDDAAHAPQAAKVAAALAAIHAQPSQTIAQALAGGDCRQNELVAAPEMALRALFSRP